MKQRVFWASGLLLIIFCTFFSAAVAAADPAETTNSDLFEKVWGIISESFAGKAEINWESAKAEYRAKVAGADSRQEAYQYLQEMVAQLGDEHTFLRTPSEVDQAMAESKSGEIIGVGMLLGTTPNEEIVALEVLPAGPARRTGVKRGDRIVAVDGEPTVGLSVGEVAASIRGERGTTVTLTLRDPFDKQREVDITRAPVKFEPAVSSGRLAGGIAYLAVPSFRTGMDVQALSQLRKLYRSRALLLDLRHSDGVVQPDVLFKIAGLFTDKPLGALATRQGAFVLTPDREWKGGTGSMTVPAPTSLDYYDKPVAVLVDGSAAASVFSLALVQGLQDSGRAVLVGRGPEPDPSIGSGQTYTELPGGGILSVTSSYLVSLKSRTLVDDVNPNVTVPMDADFLKAWYQGKDLDIEAGRQTLLDLLEKERSA